MPTMQGLILPGNSTVEFRDFDVPTPGHGQVVLKTKASSICGWISAIYRAHLGKGARDIGLARLRGMSLVGR